MTYALQVVDEICNTRNLGPEDLTFKCKSQHVDFLKYKLNTCNQLNMLI